MKNKFLNIILVGFSLFNFGCGANSSLNKNKNETLITSKEEAIEILRKVNDEWQLSNPEHEDAFWHRAAYHTGNMAAYEVTKEPRYLDFSTAWANKNEWKGAKSDNRCKWKYSYGETDDFVLFGDWQTCFQVYADLYDIEPADYKIARAIEVMEFQMSTDQNDYWWWADGLYMVMPVMTKLYNITNNVLYLNKLYEYFIFAKELMYDEESGLFYRDAKYIFPDHKTKNGKKDFWARGNGWVFAGLAKVLEDLPLNDKHRDEYIQVYQTMAASLKNSQQAEGYWGRSILDLQHAPSYETSGTAFFVYGYLWGINNSFLNEKEYLSIVEKGWEYLTEIALQENGKVGYVQPIGERADQHSNVGPETTADFGVGAFLLAASEMVKYSKSKTSITQDAIWKDDHDKHINAHGGDILHHKETYYCMDNWSLETYDELLPDKNNPKTYEGYNLIWNDEFNINGAPDRNIWSFEKGFVRNNELQWYQEDNAECKDGVLTITARSEDRDNPIYEKGSDFWANKREKIEYSSSSIKTQGNKEFQYGRFEIRARIPIAGGSWPAIWTLGTDLEWPSNGEIDIMEYYRIDGVPHILANTAWGTDTKFKAIWDSSAKPFSYFTDKDPNWADKFHVWRMDWDEKSIQIYLDDELLNETLLSETNNGSLGDYKNPFMQPHYILLNLAIGGRHGGTLDVDAFPLNYEVDYVRVYQKH